MKYKFFFSLLLAGSVALAALAQGYRDGIEYYKADRVSLAEELLLRNLNNADTDKAASYYYLGLISIDRYHSMLRNNKSGDQYLQQARKYFQDGVAANEKYPFNYIGLAQLDLMSGNSKNADENFKKAEKLANKDAGVHTAIARAYYNVDSNLYAKQRDKYREMAKKLVTNRVVGKKDIKENDADYYMFEGDMIFDSANGDAKLVGDACNMYEQAILVDPTTGEGYVKYADKFFTIKRNDYAISKLEEMLRVNPNSALGQRELAERLYDDGQIARALEGYATLMNNPNHFDSDESRYLSLIFFYKDYDMGYQEATKMLQKNPKNFTAQRFQYIFANYLGKDNTIELAEKLLANKSEDNRFATGDYSMIATDFIKNGRTDEAIGILEMGMKDYPSDPAILKGASDAYKAAQMYDKAADSYNDYMAALAKNNTTPTPSEYWTQSNVNFYAGARSEDQAAIDNYWAISARAANEAMDKVAGESKYLVAKRIGDIYRYSKNEPEALHAYETAIEFMERENVNDDPASAKDMLRYLTVGYYNAKDNDKAKIYFDKYVVVEPNDAQINELAKVLK